MLGQISADNYQQIIVFEEVINQTGLYAKIIDFLPRHKTTITHYGYQNGLGKNNSNLLEEILQNLIN